ncbi:MAG: hypothetical protein K0B81_03135 [Candidatus Cloacimonetes bacterium]|nr:hypothetical protein [Candidatus Cloacimonadota bacterium]
MACDMTEQRFYETIDLDYAEEQSDSVTIYEIYGERIERLITARRIDRYYEENRIDAKVVNITDYNEDETVRMTLYADFLTIDESYNTYEAKDNVVINHENAILYTDLLTWDQNNDEIFAPNEVIIVRGDNVLKGYELVTDADFTRIELSRVTAEGHLDDEDFADIVW